jgi:MFS family permease
MVLPFTPFMVQDFFGLRDDDPSVGYYSGLLVGLAALAEFLGSIPIGMLSDRIGRRPILLSGLIASTIFIPLFGFSTSFEMAVIVRVCRGLCNSNIGTPDCLRVSACGAGSAPVLMHTTPPPTIYTPASSDAHLASSDAPQA